MSHHDFGKYFGRSMMVSYLLKIYIGRRASTHESIYLFHFIETKIKEVRYEIITDKATTITRSILGNAVFKTVNKICLPTINLYTMRAKPKMVFG